ncbi:1-deoxy-D-xylulose-5-phosphate synthase [Chitinophaga ginsengisegetis]|uniref:1-deoxy-D-xylulose-5-phosphate synthase n=1 Tax=Chitinophaga ginsengisegetis TaxID=393003 RepID=A0A1T5NQJ0_9BACT|nr:1-deoxy-D-xylulose-5-phosphate synthase [Chitinophaga ginsengisegetis]MDR6565816.1 1-deoxy-D-xylulose-5-phosphate synthase [Chitinophaga ginsengisegetis]MDR6645545.1 1-deoxy-D-xylulose-5-phosphate synthase [Chitinophaga ginsengisegetis]MDR6651863.1 1-deoxy-D-xylulose-5-phosphate synthase [Chitinophaga ginsengisegetis]SKD02781.1 1-deoxy-D-xylulose-5-phosphate synthase [Chitinophaga ginsengisegetis]
MNIKAGQLLSQIEYPADLRKLNKEQLHQVCEELRQYIIDVVSVHGGHFAASLGVVELTVALHYVFNTPYDQLVWDVGHQAYGHKILTGRRETFPTNRKYKGLSGFPKRDESRYDTFGVGHSSTSISAALGMAMASHYKGEFDRQHIAVIGDGAMTAGMAFEALNHAGVANANVLIILNDNCMSIDPNVGALKEYLTDITTSPTYNKVRDDVWNLLGKLPVGKKFTRDMASKLEASLKGVVSKSSNLFEALKMRYFGPIDGHNITKLADTLQDLKDIPGPKLLHIVTTKGKGYALAEKDQTTWHAPGLFDKITGEIFKKPVTSPQPPKYQDVFGHTIIELAEQNDKIIGITPAMPSGSSLKFMMEKMPQRAFDVGICEQHAVTLSAGMATQGMRVFCNIYSSFFQRAFDQAVHDVAIQKLPVIFCLDRAGLVGEDGPTHHGAYDIAYMRSIPNVIISAPMNEEEMRNLMYSAQLPENDMPYVIRYPRGQGVMPEWRTPFKAIKAGTGRKIRDGKDIAILSLGHTGNFVAEACKELIGDGLQPAHYDMRFVKPLDETMLHEIFQSFDKIITVEDGTIVGGFGSAVIEFMAANNYKATVKRLGIPDRIVEHGKPEELYRECGYDAAGIARTTRDMLKEKITVTI